MKLNNKSAITVRTLANIAAKHIRLLRGLNSVATHFYDADIRARAGCYIEAAKIVAEHAKIQQGIS